MILTIAITVVLKLLKYYIINGLLSYNYYKGPENIKITFIAMILGDTWWWKGTKHIILTIKGSVLHNKALHLWKKLDVCVCFCKKTYIFGYELHFNGLEMFTINWK